MKNATHDRAVSLGRAFEDWVASTPEALAFKHGGLALSYLELDRAANRLAHAMVEAGAAPGERVALLARKPVNLAVAQIAVLKAGMVCVPLDADFGMQRLGQVLSQCGVTLSLIDRDSRADLRPLLAGRRRVLDVDAPPPGLPSHRPPAVATDGALAYVLYTSGSTGRPKGVMQNHRNLLQVARLYRTDLGLDPGDRLTNPSALIFTATIWALLATLTSGASFIVAEADSAQRLVATLARERITVLQAIVSLLREIMLGLDEPPDLPSLRLVYTGGETLHRADVTTFARVFGERRRLMVDLGSTEASVIAQFAADEWVRHAAPGTAAGLLPCGRPVESVDVALVDERGQPVGTGAIGEIVVHSPFLSPGYWNDPELTAQRFRTDPADETKRAFLTGDVGRWLEDGTLLHLGRIDDQVKVRGHRVRLAEVEAAVREIAGVRVAAVVPSLDSRLNARIEACVAIDPTAKLSANGIRRSLAERLPRHMVPATITFVDNMPTTSTGKIDRAALASVGSAAKAGYPRPRWAAEPMMQTLAALWTEVLEVAPAERSDDFLALGGDSLMLMRLIGRIEATWGLDVGMPNLLEHSTLEAMAHFLASRIAGGDHQSSGQRAAPTTRTGVAQAIEQALRRPGDAK